MKEQAKFEIVGEIGKGSFGNVYRGWHDEIKEYVAVKVERNSSYQLKNEYRILKYLEMCEGTPKVYWFDKIDDNYVMVMELLGPTLGSIRLKNDNFSISSIGSTGEQIIDHITMLHKKRIIHRDIKPENILIGLQEKYEQLYLIDFGLAKIFEDRHGKHIEVKHGKKLTGTARYASIHTHVGIEQSRRDDLETIFYMLVYLHWGTLPWCNVQLKNKQQKYDKIKIRKQRFRQKQAYLDLPIELKQIYTYILSLEFTQKPDYTFIRGLLSSLKQYPNPELPICQKSFTSSTFLQPNQRHARQSNPSESSRHVSVGVNASSGGSLHTSQHTLQVNASSGSGVVNNRSFELSGSTESNDDLPIFRPGVLDRAKLIQEHLDQNESEDKTGQRHHC